ncbi:glucose-1-phosphate adenylyltransferase subunit GlgD [Clostridium sp. YIM B02551]|uniref:glucose-1-phosphate adenylyltransferase subunit GlgD n=1 Tax=Clostridium sp. YIM B02551 TaxID=2910679 RepID=UPI001EEA22B2|nr:glucose-1-phosphate adenylyltransferase subunit GlgD [Clostridium sp. YIM B02551]
MKNCIGIINLDEREDRIRELTRNRPLASVPIAGRYRIIDFILSNMTNSGISNIGVFTRNNSRSLVDHVNSGNPWDLNRKIDGLRVFNFSHENPIYDDVHIFANNIEFFKLSRQEYVLMAPSYMICNIDYNEVMNFHIENNSDITVIYKKVNNADKNFINCSILDLSENNKVMSIGENIGSQKEANIFMEMYLLKKSLFIELIYDCIKSGACRKIKNSITSRVNQYNVQAYEFKGYLSCINSLKMYYDCNMDLLNTRVNNELFFDNGPIYTKSKNEAPTKYTKDSNVTNSIVANGCYIEGAVENCIISRRAKIKKGARVKDCIILQNAEIGPKAILENVVVDKNVVIEKGEEIKGSKKFPLTIEKERIF